MKKFLLVLSCCLATWCSVLAGPKSSPEISMMQASAPAPTNYPAVINSATHKPKEQVIEVNFKVNTAGTVAFSLDGGKTNAWSQYRGTGTYTAKVPFKSTTASGMIAITISVGGGICGGIGVPIIPIDPSAAIHAINHDDAKGTVIVDYTTSNPNNETCSLKVFVDGVNSAPIVNKVVPAGSNKYSLSSSLFKDDVDYRAELYCGSAKSTQKFKLNAKPSGYISNVTLSGIGANNLPTNFTLDYNLKNAKDPYLYIKEYNAYGKTVKKLSIYNTNGADRSVSYTNICSVLLPNTAYTACLYDGTKDLCIYHDFKMPEEKHYVYNFEWHYMGPGTNKVCIMPSKNIHPSITQVTIKVDRYKDGKKDSYQYTASGDARKDYYFGVSGDYTYIITVSWPNGERKTIQAYICAK